MIKSYFGLKPDDVKDREKTIEKCVKRAYLDVCRTLRLSENGKNEVFYKSCCSDLVKIFENEQSAAEKKNKAFSYFFKNGKLKTEFNKFFDVNKPFTYGQAQKWINMTLKYMWLFGFVKEEKALDAPIDGLIADIVGKDDPNFHKGKTWSDMHEPEYNSAQAILDKKYKTDGYSSKIEWENNLWTNN